MARMGQFGLANTTYGTKVATVQPVDNKTTLDATQTAQAQANAQAQTLLELINSLRSSTTTPRAPATTTTAPTANQLQQLIASVKQS